VFCSLYTDEECSALRRAARQYEEKGSPVKWELLIQACLATGMRRGELLNATWRDIDFAKMAVDVSPKKDRNETWEWHIKDTDRRTLPLTDELVKLLAEHQASQPEGCPYVFVPASRYEHIQARRRAGSWTVEDVHRTPSYRKSSRAGTLRRREWQTPDTFQTCHKRSFGENDDFPWGKAVPVVALYNGTTAWSESPWCMMLAVNGERK